MITRKRFLSMFAGLPFVPSFLKKEEFPLITKEWPNSPANIKRNKAIRDSFANRPGQGDDKSAWSIAPDVIVSYGTLRFQNGEVVEKYCNYYWEKRTVDFSPEEVEKIAEMLVRDGFIVEFHTTDKNGKLVKEVRYRL